MNATEALQIVEVIPSEDFITGNYSNGLNKCCFLGHCGRVKSNDPNNFSYDNCEGGRINGMVEKSAAFFKKHYNLKNVNIIKINDYNKYPPYTEPEIKDRLVHLLTDMKNAGY